MAKLAKLALGFAAVLSAPVLIVGCGDDCARFESPCPQPFDVANWCAKNNCLIDGKPTTCNGPNCTVGWCVGSTCDFAAGSILSIPIADFAAELMGKDLRMSVANGGCGDGGDALIRASLDGVDGAHSKIDGADVFVWNPFPTAPQLLELSYSNANALGCIETTITFVDIACDALHPAPNCPV